jgi:hypothetical protein
MIELKLPRMLLPFLIVIVVALAGAGILHAADSASPLSQRALREIAQVEAEIDRIEAQTLSRLAAPPGNQVQQIELLGKAMLYDRQLSVHRNDACAFCHMPERGFTGAVSELNRTTGSYPGSIRTRFSERKPQNLHREKYARANWEIDLRSGGRRTTRSRLRPNILLRVTVSRLSTLLCLARVRNWTQIDRLAQFQTTKNNPNSGIAANQHYI